MAYKYQTDIRIFDVEELNAFLTWVFDNEVSDVVLSSDKRPYISLHGSWEEASSRRLTTNEIASILDEIYIKSASARLKGGKDLDFAYEFKLDRVKRLRFRVNATSVAAPEGVGDAISVTLRPIPSCPPDPSELAVENKIMDAALTSRDGVILITGPTGSGKSTLASAILGKTLQEPSGKHLITAEAPIEFNLSKVPDMNGLVEQSEVGRHIPSFADAIRNSLRRAPDIIFVGESRDKETIEGTIRAGQTGHLVYSTTHTAGVSSTIPRMVDEFDPADRHSISVKLVDSLRMIIYQTLVPDTSGKRVALREYLIFTPEVRRNLISRLQKDGPALQDLLKEVLLEEGQPLLKDAKAKFESGRIDEHQLMLIEKESSHV